MEAQLLAQRPDQQRRSAQVVPWQTRKQMVLYLELQTAMEPIQPCMTAPVHRPTYLHSCGLCHLCKGLALVSDHVSHACRGNTWLAVLQCDCRLDDGATCTKTAVRVCC